MANTLLSKKIIVPVAIFFGGLLIASGILISANIASAQSSATSQSAQWTENTGVGISVPACGSSSNGLPTCTGNTVSVVLNWSAQSPNPEGLDCVAVSVFLNGLDYAQNQPCSGSYTATGLSPNTSYTYSISETQWPFHEYGSGSFVTPNCAPAPVSDIRANDVSGSITIPINTAAQISWCGPQPGTPCLNATSCSVFDGETIFGASPACPSGNPPISRNWNNGSVSFSCGAQPPQSCPVTGGWGAYPSFILGSTYNCSGPVNPCSQGLINAAVDAGSNPGWTAAICSGSGAIWSGTSGSYSTGNLSTSTSYTLTCSGPGGTSNDDVMVNVSGTPPPPIDYTVAASIDSGLGTITGPGISCPGDCGESYPDGTWVTLIATPSPSYFFTSWASSAGSICGGQGSACSALIDADKTASVNFSTSPPPFNYSLSNSGTSNVTKTSGDAFTTNTITKTLITGATESVTLSLSGVPAGVSAAISNQGCSPTCTSVITFTVPSSTPVGTYPIIVTGSPLNRQTNFNLVVSGSPFSVSCSASPSPAFLGQTVTWTAVISGGTPPFSYSWSGTNIPTNPAPNTNPFSIVYNTIGQKTAIVTVTDTDSVQASCPVGIVQIKFDPRFEEF